jgi:hypothetical protein
MTRAVLVLVVGACTGDTGTFDQRQIQESIAQVRLVVPAMIARDGITASVAMGRFTSAASRILVPDDPAMWHVSIDELLEAAPGTDTVTDLRHCTAVDCSFSYNWSQSLYTSYGFGGSVTRSGDTLDFEINSGRGFRRITGSSSTVTGSVTLTADTFAGSVEAHATAFDNNMTPGPMANADYKVTFRNLVLDGNGCAVSGSMSAELHYTASGAWDAALDIEASADIIPACD